MQFSLDMWLNILKNYVQNYKVFEFIYFLSWKEKNSIGYNNIGNHHVSLKHNYIYCHYRNLLKLVLGYFLYRHKLSMISFFFPLNFFLIKSKGACLVSALMAFICAFKWWLIVLLDLTHAQALSEQAQSFVCWAWFLIKLKLDLDFIHYRA